MEEGYEKTIFACFLGQSFFSPGTPGTPGGPRSPFWPISPGKPGLPCTKEKVKQSYPTLLRYNSQIGDLFLKIYEKLVRGKN